MTVSYASSLTILKPQELLAPAMGATPLATMLETANSAYRLHTPPLVSFAPIMASGTSRSRRFVVSAPPSADGLRYRVRHQILPAYNGNVTVTVETGTSVGWTTVYGPTVVAGLVSGAWTDHSHTIVVPATEDRLRFTYSGGTGAYLVSHVLAYPDPDTAAPPFVAPFARLPSGFWPGDDALLGAAGNPVHAEMLDRCWRNPYSVVRDRWQAVGSLVQEDGHYGNPVYRGPFATVPFGQWGQVGRCRPLLPYQFTSKVDSVGSLKVDVRVAVLAAVTGGSDVGRIRVVALSDSGFQSEATFDATGSLLVDYLAVELDGTANAGFDLQFFVKGDAGQSVDLHSAVLHWRPGD